MYVTKAFSRLKTLDPLHGECKGKISYWKKELQSIMFRELIQVRVTQIFREQSS